MNFRFAFSLLLLALSFSVTAVPAQAYVGPGAGIGMIGSLLAVVAVVGLAIFSLILLPFRMIMKSRKNKAAKESAEAAE